MNPLSSRSVFLAALAVLLQAGLLQDGLAAGASLTPAADTAALMPRHGTVSIAPAAKWED